MLYSIVIPTRNRFDLLTEAIETIRHQDGANWELLIFDNASDKPVGSYIDSLADPRIRCERSEVFLPVTDSWNRAMAMASGDYVTLLGDDDGLVPDYFRRLQEIVERFDRPELIYTNLYQFMHPGVAPWAPEGYVSDLKYAFFFGDRSEPFVLSEVEAFQAVSGSLHLRRNFTYNSQAFSFSRALLSRISNEGRVYLSPFPDYYIANVAIALSRSTIIVPAPLAIAGVSKASFGFTLFNGLEGLGASMLNTKLREDPVHREIDQKLLPGPAYQINYAVTMEYVARATQDVYHERVDFGRHRRLQIISALQHPDHGSSKDTVWPDLRRRLSPSEGAWADAVEELMALRAKESHPIIVSRVIPDLLHTVSPYAFEPVQRYCDRGTYSRLPDVYAALQSEALH
jgi:glycosyltransferase involved in cell wall biosynthesis